MAKPAFRVAAEAEGLADAIRTLGKVDRELKKELVRSMKKAADPLVAEARSLVPSAKPLTNWYGWKGGWSSSKVQRGIKVSQRNTAQRNREGQRQLAILLTVAGRCRFGRAVSIGILKGEVNDLFNKVVVNSRHNYFVLFAGFVRQICQIVKARAGCKVTNFLFCAAFP